MSGNKNQTKEEKIFSWSDVEIMLKDAMHFGIIDHRTYGLLMNRVNHDESIKIEELKNPKIDHV